ncbi:MAG: choice-of-anchor D domain-containing protein [Candidatus Acidiferrum sp.]
MGSSSRRFWAFAFFGLALAICAFFVFFPSSDSRNSAQLPTLWHGAQDVNDARVVAAKSSPDGGAQFLQQEHSYFERNAGQVDGEVLYLNHGKDYSLFLTRAGVTVVLPEAGKGAAADSTSRYFRLRFEGANPKADVTGIEKLPGTSNYFSGSDPKLWRTRVPQYGRVRYSNLYPGVDVVFYFRDGQLEYDVIASPGADPKSVHLRVEGATPSLTREGDIAIKMRGKEVVRFKKPRAYQSSSAAAVVTAEYSLRGGDLAFALGRYDHDQPLTIDPALAFATFLSSNCVGCTDFITDVAADNSGVYLTGSTNAPIFPVSANGSGPTAPQDNPTFIVKIDPTGSHVLYAVFLGNSGGQAMTVDSTGSAYVSGVATFPAQAGSQAFPLTSGVFSNTIPSNVTGGAAYAAKLSPDGSTLIYSTLLQQPISSGTPVNNFQFVTPSKIALDSNGALYITGVATQNSLNRFTSIWGPLPVTVGAFQTSPGADFVLKLNQNATGLDYATYIDGPNPSFSSVAGIAVNSSGDAFVAGSGAGPGFLTTAGAYQTSPTTGGDAFVMALNPTGTGQIYSTLFGQNASATGLALDSNSRAVLTGWSSAAPPVTPNAFCGNVISGDFAGFVTKFKTDGSGLIYSTTLCDGDTQGGSVAVDSTGAAYVIGLVSVPSDFQPNLLHPIQGYPPSTGNVNIAVKLDNTGIAQWATFFGHSSGLIGQGIPSASTVAVDGNSDAYILCSSTILPTANSLGPAALTPGAGNDTGEIPNFLLKIAPSLGASVPEVSPQQLSFTNQNVGTFSSSQDVQVGNFGDAAASPMVSIIGDFLETDNCSAGVAAGQKCDISVVFKPSVTGPRTGTLTVAFGGSIASQTVALSGNAGQAGVILSPTSLTFGTQPVGTTSGAQQISVTNNGTGPLQITSVQTTGPFAATTACGAPVGPSSDCTIQVTFTPTSDSVQTGTLTIADNAPGSPQTVALTGNSAGGGGGTGGGGGGGTGTPPGVGLGVPSGGSASATVTAGSTATYGLSIGGAGISGTAALNCTGAPTGATCSVPNSVTLSATTPSTFNVSVTTTAHSGVGLMQFERPLLWLWPLATLGCLTLLIAISAARPVRMRWRFVPAFALILCACGGGGSPAPSNPTPSGNSTSAGTYTIVVTAKSGSSTQSQNLTLVVK